MKKLSIFILVLSLMLISTSALASEHMMEKGTWTFGADFDLGTNITVGDAEPDVSSGFTLDGEYVMPAKNKVSYGGGIAYQLARTYTENENKEFSFIPLYGLAKYEMQQNSYLVGHLGYNLFNGNDAFKDGDELGGGFYYAAGVGVGMEQYNADLLYSVSNGTKGNDDVSYSKLSLSFGMSF